MGPAGGAPFSENTGSWSCRLLLAHGLQPVSQGRDQPLPPRDGGLQQGTAMPLNVRRKIGESIDIDSSIRIFVDDINFDPVNRESNCSLRVIERDTGGHLSHLLFERESAALTHAGQGIEVRLLHVMSHVQCLLQVSAPQAIRILRTELLTRGVTHE